MIVVPTYRGFRIEVNAVAVDGRYNAEVRNVGAHIRPNRRYTPAPRGGR